MAHVTDTYLDEQGNVRIGFFVRVLDKTSGAVISIYSDEASTPIETVSGVANQAKTDATGRYDFYVPDGDYDLEFLTPTSQGIEIIRDQYFGSAVGATTIVQDNLTGTSATEALSANQGRVLKEGQDIRAATYPTRTTLKAAAASATNLDDFYLSESGREGKWIYKTGDYSAEVTADTQEGVYMQAGSIPTTTGALVRDFSGDINSAWFGVTPNAITTSSYKSLVQFAAAYDYTVFFDAGTYDFGAGNIMDSDLNPGGDVGALRIKGIPDETIFEDIGSAHYSGVIKVDGIKFTNSDQPVYMTGNITEIEIVNSNFTGVRRAIYHNDTTSGVAISKGLIEDNVFTSHTEAEFLGCVLLHRAETARNVKVRNNEFKDIVATGTSIVQICQIGESSNSVDNYSNNEFTGNEITGCGNNIATYVAATSFGCTLIGYDLLQANNYIHDNHWMQPVYAKGDGVQQLKNHCRDNQFSGITIKVYDTTLTSKENIQDGNIITGQCDLRPAVRMFGSGRSLNSIVDITATAQVGTQGGLCFQQTLSNTTDGKITVTGDFKGPKGISMTTGGDIEIDVRLESAGDGINITPASGKTVGRVKVNGIIISEGAALQANPVNYLDTSGGLYIRCNRSNGAAITAYVRDGCDLSGTRLFITDDDADGISAGRPILLYAKDGGETANCNINLSDFTFVTERNVTSVFRHFADAGLISPNLVNIKMDNVTIDLQGNTCTNLIDILNDVKKISLNGCEVDGTMTRTVDGSSHTIDKLLINNGLLDYIATDNAVTHFNGTATASRVGNNKTA